MNELKGLIWYVAGYSCQLAKHMKMFVDWKQASRHECTTD